MSEPKLSVVVASVNGFPYLGHCLDALAERAPGAEVIVADSTDEETRRRLQEGWPAVKLLSFDEPQTVPELRAAGIFAAGAPHVAVIEDHCRVTPELGGGRSSQRMSGGTPSSAGRFATSSPSGARDWAAFFCEYSAFMEPLPEGEAKALTGMNVVLRPQGDRGDRTTSCARGAGRAGCTHGCKSAASASTAPPTWCSSTTRTSASASSSRSATTTRARTPACAT